MNNTCYAYLQNLDHLLCLAACGQLRWKLKIKKRIYNREGKIGANKLFHDKCHTPHSSDLANFAD